MSEVNISKVKLHKTKKGNGLVLTLQSTDSAGEQVDSTETHKSLIHPDLQVGIDALALHLGIMTGYIKPVDVDDVAFPEVSLAASFHINGYSLGGDSENQGIVISGYKILPNGMAVILNTPFTRFEQNPESRYQFMDDVIARVNVIESEITKYLGGKRGTPEQQELFDDAAAAAADSKKDKKKQSALETA